MYWFIFLFTDPHVAALLRMTYSCHLERPQGVESSTKSLERQRKKSKSYKYNKYPRLPARKTGLFMANAAFLNTPSRKTGLFMAGKQKSISTEMLDFYYFMLRTNI